MQCEEVGDLNDPKKMDPLTTRMDLDNLEKKFVAARLPLTGGNILYGDDKQQVQSSWAFFKKNIRDGWDVQRATDLQK